MHDPSSKVRFSPRWKEEWVCTMDGRTFVIEITMGQLTVYLATLAHWEASAPAWAKDQWARVRTDLTAWCKSEGIPLIIEDDAWVHFEQ